MKINHRTIARGLAFAVLALCVLWSLRAAPSRGEPGPKRRSRPEFRVEEKDRVPLAVARDRAKLMHDMYVVTMDVIHDRYFHSQRSVVPARALEDVFTEMRRQQKVEARWFSVNLKAMSVDHEPESAFEKDAVVVLASGKPDYEVVENGYYRRAASITLHASCVNCHAGFFKEATKTPKYAGLAISIPIIDEATAATGATAASEPAIAETPLE